MTIVTYTEDVSMQRGKRARHECNQGCCRDHKPKKYGYRAREKRAWRKDAR